LVIEPCIHVTPRERRATARLLATLASQFRSVTDDAFVEESAVLAHRLPSRLRSFVNRCRLADQPSYFVLRGYDVGAADLPATPPHWNAPVDEDRTFPADALLMLHGALLGDVFGWGTQQDGRLVAEILPIRGKEHEQLGAGSEAELAWHTEDAFHEYRADYICLLCLRNRDQTPTTVASIGDVRLSTAAQNVLREPRFMFYPDHSHRGENNPDMMAEQRSDLGPRVLPILSGPMSRPNLRIDPPCMAPLPADAEAISALGELTQSLERVVSDVVLRPGDLCVLNNRRVVHGRRPFAPSYDGADRWLKRVCVSRDLHRSTDARDTTRPRVLR
jgi:Fe(II)/alpha-ketoglutarate-dependent arginine beta-hydroxylase